MPFWDPQRETNTLQSGDILTLTDADATPDVSGYSNVLTANTGATTITDFDNPETGHKLRVEFGDANTTIQASANIRMQGGVTSPTDDFGPGAVGDKIDFTYNGTQWVEDGRSLNS